MADKATKDAEKEVQAMLDKEQAQGFRGTEVDQTPNEAYTVGGVLKNMPTPETDPQTAADVRRNWAPLTKGDEK
jgi:hypothetical protein